MFGRIDSAVAVDVAGVPNVSGSVRLEVTIPWGVDWVPNDPAAVAAFVERCVAVAVAGGHSAWVVAVGEVPA